jgi:large subunit ribosomal protein L14
MIQTQSILKVSDNSGAKTAKCIKVLGGFKKKFAKVGDTIVVSIQNLRNKSKHTSKVKKGEVYRAILIRTKINYTNKDGSKVIFQDNAVTLINKQNNPISTRIIGPVSRVLKKKKFQKIISISSGLI